MQGVTAEEIQQTLCDVFRKDDTIILAVLYGSAARNGLSAHSDVDLAVAARGKMSLPDRVELAMRLELQLKRQVDLVDLRAIEGLILRQVLTKGVVLKNGDPSLLASLIKKVVYHDADMMPLLERMLLAKAKRFASGQSPRSQEAGSPSQVHRADRGQTAG